MIPKIIMAGIAVGGLIVYGVIREFGRFADDACAWMNNEGDDNERQL